MTICRQETETRSPSSGRQCESGQALVDYVLIISIVSITIIMGLLAVNGQLAELYESIVAQLSVAIG